MKKEKATPDGMAKNSTVKYNMQIIKKYQKIGLPILPVKPHSKEPACSQWSNPEKRKKANWKDNYNVGLICGEKWRNGYFVDLDFDYNSRHFKVFKELVKQLNVDDSGILMKSGGKHHGIHFIAKVDKPITNTVIEYKKYKIEVHGYRKYTLIEPSFVESSYKFIGKKPLQELKTTSTKKLIKRLKKLCKSTQGLKNKTPGPTTLPKYSSTVVGPKTFKSFKDPITTAFVPPDVSFERLVVADLNDFMCNSTGLQVWARVLSFGGVTTDLTLKKAFSCVLHPPDIHPSARLFRSRTGEIVYLDEHLRGTSLYALPVQIVYQGIMQLKKGEALNLSTDKENLSRWFAKLIDDLNIYTQASIEFTKSFHELITQSDVPESFKMVWKVISAKMERAFDHGGDIFTARWLAKQAKVDYKKANKALNVLCSIGVLKKVDEKFIDDTRKTNKIEPMNFELDEALINLKRLESYLQSHGGWKHFSRRAVKEVFGSWMVRNIFTRE